MFRRRGGALLTDTKRNISSGRNNIILVARGDKKGTTFGFDEFGDDSGHPPWSFIDNFHPLPLIFHLLLFFSFFLIVQITSSKLQNHSNFSFVIRGRNKRATNRARRCLLLLDIKACAIFSIYFSNIFFF